jgi:DNA polymerase (family 10)
MPSATNKQIAETLREISLFLEAEGVAFKPQAYERAADVIDMLDEELALLYKKCGTACIDELPGIGKSIANKIEELVTTGRLKYYNDLKKKYPVDMLELTEIQDVGPKTVLALYKALNIKTLQDLERAAKAGKIRKVPRFGQKSEQKILKGLGFLKEHAGRFRLHDVWPLAESVVAKLRNLSGVTHCEAAGSVRRRKETIGDIDILITTSKPELAITTFKRLPEISEVLEEGATKVAVRYRDGINGDLRILRPDEYGSALVYFTGSKEHNVLIRERAIKLKMKLSEYGLFRGRKRVACKTEEEVYRMLNMDWAPPEIREASGEVEAAVAHRLPTLIPYGSVMGDLQVQTNWSDGSHSIAQMAEAARRAGLSYIAVTDHTKVLAMANGLDEKKLLQQGREIDKLNAHLKTFRVLKSTECDIRKDGSLDLSDQALKTLDLVCVSVHSYFNLEEAHQTERIIRALKHPLVHVLFHPTGRVVNAREPYKIDMPRILRVAKQFRVALEVNGSERLDLKDLHVRMAVKEGVKLVVNSDAHSPEQLRNIDFGVATARRGWATKQDVLNTKPVNQFLKAIKK